MNIKPRWFSLIEIKKPAFFIKNKDMGKDIMPSFTISLEFTA